MYLTSETETKNVDMSALSSTGWNLQLCSLSVWLAGDSAEMVPVRDSTGPLFLLYLLNFCHCISVIYLSNKHMYALAVCCFNYLQQAVICLPPGTAFFPSHIITSGPRIGCTLLISVEFLLDMLSEDFTQCWIFVSSFLLKNFVHFSFFLVFFPIYMFSLSFSVTTLSFFFIFISSFNFDSCQFSVHFVVSFHQKLIILNICYSVYLSFFLSLPYMQILS